jgi:hypothetical protein
MLQLGVHSLCHVSEWSSIAAVILHTRRGAPNRHTLFGVNLNLSQFQATIPGLASETGYFF